MIKYLTTDREEENQDIEQVRWWKNQSWNESQVVLTWNSVFTVSKQFISP